MIREIAIYLIKNRNNKEYFLMATTGTYESKIYTSIFNEYGLKILELDYMDRMVIMDWIYRVKSSKFDITSLEFERFINKYIKDMDIPVILGCTGLPILANHVGVSKDFIDPSLIIAKKMR